MIRVSGHEYITAEQCGLGVSRFVLPLPFAFRGVASLGYFKSCLAFHLGFGLGRFSLGYVFFTSPLRRVTCLESDGEGTIG